MKTWIFLLLTLTWVPTFGQTDFIRVGVLYNQKVNNILVAPKSGQYGAVAGGKVIKKMKEGDILSLQATNGKVRVRTLSNFIGEYDKVVLRQTSWGSVIKLRPGKSGGKERNYPDNLIITAKGDELKIINDVYLEHYVAGVVEAESGINKGVEYYKVQAIICRTYALKYIERKPSTQFDICDDVQCQVYKGQSKTDPHIWEAVNGTAGQVMVDESIQLIDASFHSNSGGITANSEDVWIKPLPYLRQVCDTFSLNQRHADWQVVIGKEQWYSYLRETHNYPLHDSILLDLATETCDTTRVKYLAEHGPKIDRNKVRMAFKLKSAYFNVEPYKQDSIAFVGHGYGHGVGLSQLGAMRMAELGFSFSEILHHYYTDIHIIHRSSLDYFDFED